MSRIAPHGTLRSVLAVFAAAALLSGCGAMNRLADIGKAPDMSRMRTR